MKILIVSIFYLLLFNSKSFSQNSFAKELTRSLFIYLEPPEFCLQNDSCYRYTELLKIEIDKTGKIEAICFSDSAPGWLKENLDRSIKNKIFNFRRLDSVAKDNHYVNCTLVFPVLLETSIPPTEIQKGLSGAATAIWPRESARCIWRGCRIPGSPRRRPRGSRGLWPFSCAE